MTNQFKVNGSIYALELIREAEYRVIDDRWLSMPEIIYSLRKLARIYQYVMRSFE